MESASSRRRLNVRASLMTLAAIAALSRSIARSAGQFPGPSIARTRVACVPNLRVAPGVDYSRKGQAPVVGVWARSYTFAVVGDYGRELTLPVAKPVRAWALEQGLSMAEGSKARPAFHVRRSTRGGGTSPSHQTRGIRANGSALGRQSGGRSSGSRVVNQIEHGV